MNGRSLVVLLVLALQGCATVPAGRDAAAENDPLEPFNRRMFAFNQGLDRAVIKPVAEAYRSVLPEFARDRVRAFVDNLQEPLVFVNDVLQGRGTAAGISGRRFLVNTTVGVAGLFDRATEFGLPKQSGDFGQTLYVWGASDGPYLVLPFFGPSNVRDGFGLGVDMFASPVARIGSYDAQSAVAFGVGAADGIDLRSRNIESLETLEASSLDFYSYLRSVSRQYRRAALREAKGEVADDDLVDPGRTPIRPE